MGTSCIVAIAMMVVVVLAATACYNSKSGETNIGGSINVTLPAFPETGSNAVQVFTEMHYQPSYKSQEGPRILPPSDSVPITGREIRPTSVDGYESLVPSQDVVDAFNRTGGAEGQHLYAVNCVVCHGFTLKGDGPITTLTSASGGLAMANGPFPADLTLPVTVDSTDGDLFGFISGGGRQGLSSILSGRQTRSPMPEFQLLLTEEERWQLVLYLRGLIGR